MKQNLTIAETERRLVLAAQNGSVDALDELCRMHSGFVWKSAKRVKHRHIELEDIVQVGMQALIHAIHLFDATRPVRLLTYAGCAIQRSMWRESLYARRRIVISLPEKCDMADTSEDADPCFLPEWSEEISYVRSKVQAALQHLDGRLQYIVMERFGGRTLEDIGKELAISKERVRQLQMSAMSVLREHLECCA